MTLLVQYRTRSTKYDNETYDLRNTAELKVDT